MTQNTERRKFQRIELDLAVTVYQGEVSVQAEIVDISLKGMLLKNLAGSISEGACRLDIQLGNSNTISIDGRMSHHNAQGTGFEFDRIDLEDMIELRHLLELNSGDDELISRSFSALQTP